MVKNKAMIQDYYAFCAYGDGRVKVDWGKKADGTKIYRSNFAPGTHHYKLNNFQKLKVHD